MLAPKERSYRHETATIAAEQMRTMSGLQIMQAILAGDLPLAAIAQTVGFRLVEVERGRIAFESEPSEHIYNMYGAAHGGYAATILDSALGCSVCTMLPAGTAYTTVDLTINYVRPVRVETGTVRAVGQVLHVGRRTATAEAKLLASDDKLLAHGLTTCLVFPLEERGPPRGD
jgi:uncharacterized protein (TIGR00369 family)